MTQRQPLILATGLQSGGTTVVSHSFLKHPELDGILDMASDRIEMNLARVSAPVVWVKMTTIAFRWEEVAAVYEQQGYEVYPLLIVRNPFDAWASLKHKWYGLNGVTAEDPPLMLRFSRFLKDWLQFKQHGWPVMCFEDFVANPEAALNKACEALPIEFNAAMLEAKSNVDDIAYVSESNASFAENLSQGVVGNVAKRIATLAEDEVNWLQTTFSQMIDEFGYSNRHGVDASRRELAPNPFDSRRYLGFGPQVLAKKVSAKLPSLINACTEAHTLKRPVVIYGKGDFGEYLLTLLNEHGVEVNCVIDTYVTEKDSLLHVSVFPPDKLNTLDNPFVVVASFMHASSIVDTLSEYGKALPSMYWTVGD